MADAANALISKVHTLAHTHTLTHAPKVGYPLSSVRVFPIINNLPIRNWILPHLNLLNRTDRITLNWIEMENLAVHWGSFLRGARCTLPGFRRQGFLAAHWLSVATLYVIFFSLATSVQINLCPANVWTISVSVSVSVSGSLCAIDGPIIKPEPRENARRTHGKLMENSRKTECTTVPADRLSGPVMWHVLMTLLSLQSQFSCLFKFQSKWQKVLLRCHKLD